MIIAGAKSPEQQLKRWYLPKTLSGDIRTQQAPWSHVQGSLLLKG